MKIICYSDTHGKSPDLRVQQDIGAILHGGDFYDGRILRYAAGSEACEEGIAEIRRTTDLRWLSETKAPVYAVKGNHDVADPLGIFSRVQDITGRVVELAPNLLLAGIGWSGQCFFDLPTESDLEAVCQNVRRSLARRISNDAKLILLTHYPGCFAELFPNRQIQPTWWYQTIRKLVHELKPMLVVQGHLHEHFGTSGVVDAGGDRCLILNPGPRGVVIEIEPETGELKCV
jgi:Icc-related predicted phosphoesterase